MYNAKFKSKMQTQEIHEKLNNIQNKLRNAIIIVPLFRKPNLVAELKYLIVGAGAWVI